uniref:Uncharacterized protein n=1 Tax=viral metagenome TaxID=1070528 RepID=A0A6C0EQA7_9ZZZZ
MSYNRTINVSPFQQTVVNTITSFDIDIRNVILFTQAEIIVRFYNDLKQMIDLKVITISGDDYAQWGGDDTYILKYISNKLGLIIRDTPDTTNTPDTSNITPDTTNSISDTTDVTNA